MQFGEFHREEDAFCLDRIACFGPLSISRLFRQLCQHQAHPVNHQPTKCRTADFYKRQSGTSWESGTFPIKFFSVSLYEYVLSRQLRVWEKPNTNKKQKKNMFSGALFWRMGKPRTLVTFSTMFLLLSEHSQVLTFFGPGFALLDLITFGVLHSNLIFWEK